MGLGLGTRMELGLDFGAGVVVIAAPGVRSGEAVDGIFVNPPFVEVFEGASVEVETWVDIPFSFPKDCGRWRANAKEPARMMRMMINDITNRDRF